MARHTIDIVANKSSNGTSVMVGSSSDGYSMQIPPVSDVLYLGLGSFVGIGWETSQYPRNKNIVKIELCVYAQSQFNRGIIMRYMDFGEGSTIGTPSPPDKTLSRFNGGWNYIEIEESRRTVVFGALYNSPDVFNYAILHSTRNANNKPFIRVTYDDIPPKAPTSLYPSGIIVSSRDIIRFAWSHNSEENLQQKGFILEYSTNGGSSWTTVNQTTVNQFYDMPANTLPSTGTVNWRVRTIDSNSEISEFTNASFTLGIVPQQAPIIISPISQYLDQKKEIKFEWRFMGGSQTEHQSKFDLQYSEDFGSTWTTITQTTSNQFYILPANSLESGNTLWRIRTYNNWNEVSPYSDNKSFTVIGSPATPLINSVTNKARPTVTWQTQEQQLFELEIVQEDRVIHKTGTIPDSSIRSYRVPIYLDDGTYKARLRIANEYNLYSPWAERTFIISTSKPSKPAMDVFSGTYGVTIRIKDLGFKTLVFRDNEYMGEIKNNHFTDHTGENNKTYEYFIRIIDSNDNFSDSDIKLAKCRFKGNTLAIANRPNDFIKLKTGFENIPKKSNKFNIVATIRNFDGRKYPIAEYSEFDNLVKNLSFFVKTTDEVEQIIEMIETRQIFLYRNSNGKNVYGVIFDLEYEETLFGYEIGFAITKTDYKGAIYD